MSSRNARLSAQERENAAQIYRVLHDSLALKEACAPVKLAEWVAGEINKVPGLRVEYYEIVDGYSLQPVSSWEESGRPVGCIAVFCGAVRLIDHISYR
jgi:pantoate--beta-alanine ligase